MAMQRYLERPLTQVRRKDRVLADEKWMDRMLAISALGHLAISHEGQPLLHSNYFWFDGEHLYWHTAQVGKLRAILEQGAARACFTVTEFGRVLPAGTPFDFSTEYASVILYGTVCVVDDAVEKKYALEGVMTKYAPQLVAGVDYEPMPDSDIAITSVYRFDIETRVGKHNVKPEEYPAYPYPHGSFIDAEREAGRATMRPKELA
jgi:nitroimidazol reductase NimA-like FMN-containing flavoprotein (pyridoxamine 5'-phosphate oxidase superfamily)